MQIKITQSGAKMILQIEGDINKFEIDRLKRALIDIRSFSEIVLDLSKVYFASSPLINLLIGIKIRHPKDYQKIKLLKPSDLILELFALTQIDRMYEIIRENTVLLAG